MSWAALFERAEAYDVMQAAVCDALAERRHAASEGDGDPEEGP